MIFKTNKELRPDTSLALGLLARSHINLCVYTIFRNLPLLILLQNLYAHQL